MILPVPQKWYKYVSFFYVEKIYLHHVFFKVIVVVVCIDTKK
jgi:hypothetical protein